MNLATAAAAESIVQMIGRTFTDTYTPELLFLHVIVEACFIQPDTLNTSHTAL